mmetsp:Transcript_119059/g.207282  ORF Transcript_119059/g.207282 Transcript_119059/m.207282 type:complete len:87 (-) Transcript_119059:43-303(-)
MSWPIARIMGSGDLRKAGRERSTEAHITALRTMLANCKPEARGRTPCFGNEIMAPVLADGCLEYGGSRMVHHRDPFLTVNDCTIFT